MKKNKQFEYTEDNYINSVPKDHNKFSLYMNGDNSFNNFLNGVKPLNMYSIATGNANDPYIGKTIDFYYLSEDNDFWFMGFTDGTFVLRERTDHNFAWDSTHKHEPDMYWSDSYFLNPDICVTNNLSYFQRNKKDIRPKITCIGKWIEEHTDADIIGYYNAVVKEQERRDTIAEKNQHKRDLEEFNRLKEKLGL